MTISDAFLTVTRSDLVNGEKNWRRDGTFAGYAHPLPSTLYKFVDLKDAHYLETGSIKIGNSATYSQLENGRADNLDGTVEVCPKPFSLKRGEGADEREGMQQFGHFLNGDIDVSGGVRFEVAERAQGVLCFSTEREAPSLDKPDQAVFRIDNVEAFALQLLTKVNQEVMHAGKVAYTGTRLDTFQNVPPRGTFPFRKDKVRLSDGYSFEGEREFRFVFPQIDINYVGSGLPPDIILKHLMTRIK